MCWAFYKVSYNKTDFIEANCLLASINCFIYTLWQQRNAKICMLCIWLHLRDDLKMQYSVDIMCDVIIIEITTVFLG